MHVVVAGGGLAGLVAARHLAEAGATVDVLESRERVGGRVRSRTVDGFTLDRGFQVLFTAYPAARRELDFDALELRKFAPGATIAKPNHRSTLADPFGDPGAALPTLLNRDVRTADKLRLFRLQRELRRRDVDGILGGGGTLEGNGDTTVRQYLADRGFSKAFVENFAEPFYGGITLDRTLGTSSRVFEYTFKMLSEGETVVPAEGMSAIPEQLRRRAEAAGATVETDTPVTAIDAGEDPEVEADGERLAPDAVVVATDPKSAAELVGIDPPAESLGCVTVHCSLPEHQSLDTGSRILLNAEDANPNTVAPMSAAAPEYAPDDAQLLSATFLGESDASDGELVETVRTTLDAWYPENHFGELDVLGVDRIEFAQFAQSPGFRGTLPAVDTPDGAVYLAGDYTRWSAIQGALESGRLAAEAALDSQ